MASSKNLETRPTEPWLKIESSAASHAASGVQSGAAVHWAPHAQHRHRTPEHGTRRCERRCHGPVLVHLYKETGSQRPRLARQEDCKMFEGRINICSETQLFDDYSLGERLGTGAFSTVYEARNNVTKQTFACKKVVKSDLQLASHKEGMRREIALMQKLFHPTVVQLYRIYESDEAIYLIQEFLAGGELFHRIVNDNPEGFPEKDAANIFARVLEGVSYLHQLDIAHRDLKPENLIYHTEQTVSQLKITDFGLSRVVPQNGKLYDSVGTPQYVAPEVLLGIGHDTQCDMWSLGVVLYILLTGSPPFGGDNEQDMYESIVRGDYDFPEFFDDVSDGAIDLIRHLLVVDPLRRYTAKQAMDHPWIRDRELNSTARKWKSSGIRKRFMSQTTLGHYKKSELLCRFRAAAAAVIATVRLRGGRDFSARALPVKSLLIPEPRLKGPLLLAVPAVGRNRSVSNTSESSMTSATTDAFSPVDMNVFE